MAAESTSKAAAVVAESPGSPEEGSHPSGECFSAQSTLKMAAEDGGGGRLEDPHTQGYRSIVDVVNRKSDSFKRRQQKRADNEAAATVVVGVTSSASHHAGLLCSPEEGDGRLRPRMVHSRTMDPAGSADVDRISPSEGRPSSRGRRLVRQKATTNSSQTGQEEEGNGGLRAEIVDETSNKARPPRPSPTSASRLAPPSRGMPSRQWTVDTCTGLKTPMQENSAAAALAGGSTAYLLRPVSRNSINGKQEEHTLSTKKLSPVERPRSPLPHRSPAAAPRERVRLGELATRSAMSSFARSMDASVSSSETGGPPALATRSGGRNARIYERALMPHLHYHANRKRLAKQKTTDSAPTTSHTTNAGQNGTGGGQSPVTSSGRDNSHLSSSSRYLPRQPSNASAYSAVMPTSNSYSGITLVRGASCSLVDIPTYLGPSLAAGGGVELAHPVCEVTSVRAVVAPVHQASISSGAKGSIGPGPGRQRLQLDLTKRKNEAREAAKEEARKTQWTVLCVSLTLLTLAVTLVGGMLSVGSHYQEMVIARQWEALNRNQSRVRLPTSSSSAILDEPFVIVPDGLDFDLQQEGNATHDADGARKANRLDGSDYDGESPSVPLIFPELTGRDDLLAFSELVKRERASPPHPSASSDGHGHGGHGHG